MCFNDIASVFFQFSFMRHQRSSRMYLSYSRQTTTLWCFPSFRITASQDESQGLVSKTWAIWKEMGSFWGSQFVGKRELLSVSSTTAQGLLGQVPEEERCGRVQQARMEGHTQVLQMLTLFCAFSSRRRRRNKKEDFMAWNHTHRAPAEGCACCWGKPGKTGIIRWGNWPGSGLDVVVHVWFSCKTRQKCWW